MQDLIFLKTVEGSEDKKENILWSSFNVLDKFRARISLRCFVLVVLRSATNLSCLGSVGSISFKKLNFLFNRFIDFLIILGIVLLFVTTGDAKDTDSFVEAAAEHKISDVTLNRVEMQDLEAESAHLLLISSRLFPIIDWY